MKIQICSDLHLEFSENRKWLKDNPLVPKGDILLIAGDTYYLNRSYHKLDFIKKVSDEFEAVYIIPGNHEYYEGYDISTGLAPTKEQITANVMMLNNVSLELGDFKLICSTFWSKIERNALGVLRGMADFRRIKYKEERFNINHFNELHEHAFQFVSDEIKGAGRHIVVTHHLPSSQCNVAEFKNSILNEAFYVEKTDFILGHDIDYWIYGHSHRNKSDFSIGNTQMITNQFGYVGLQEHRFFNYEKVIELK